MKRAAVVGVMGAGDGARAEDLKRRFSSAKRWPKTAGCYSAAAAMRA
jgi:hypothetical protein